MTKQGIVSLLLLVGLIVPTGLGTVEAAHSEAVLAPISLGNPDVNAIEVGIEAETDVLEELLASFTQWLDKFLASDATRNTSVISIWNH
jgi:hypothetical protein